MAMKVVNKSEQPAASACTISLSDAQEVLRYDAAMQHALLRIPFPAFYFCVFVGMLFTHIPANALYEQGASLTATLASSGTDAITTDTTMKFENIQALADVFDWLEDTLVPSVFVTEDYNGDTLSKDKWGRVAMYNKVLGAVNLRVTNSVTHSCVTQPFLKELYPYCYNRDNTTVNNVLISFDTNTTVATKVLEDLKTSGAWIDYSTQQLLVKIIVYNGELQGYAVTALQIDMNAGGTLELSSSTTPTLSNAYKNTAATVVDVLVFFCLVIVVYADLRKLYRHRRDLASVMSMWMLVELASSALVIAFYAVWYTIVLMMFDDKFRKHLARLVVSGNSYATDSTERQGLLAVTSTLEMAASLTIALRIIALFTVATLALRILKRFRAHPRLGLLARTIALALKQFGAFFIVFAVIYMAFTVSGTILFGDRVEGFSSLPKTMATCINMLFGNFDFSTIQDVFSPVGLIYYWAYMIVVSLVLLNLMLAIVLDAYAEASNASSNTIGDPSLKRIVRNLIYEMELLVRRPSNVVAFIGNARRRYERNAFASWTRERVVHHGRIQPQVLMQAINFEMSDKTKLAEGGMLTPLLLLKWFPGANVQEHEATRTIRHLLHGIPRQKENDGPSVDTQAASKISDCMNEDRGAEAVSTAAAPRSIETTITSTEGMDSALAPSAAVDNTLLLQRLEQLEAKLDALLTRAMPLA